MKVADWTIRNMQDQPRLLSLPEVSDGNRARTPMLHWGQATMFKGLANLVLSLSPDQKKPAWKTQQQFSVAGPQSR